MKFKLLISGLMMILPVIAIAETQIKQLMIQALESPSGTSSSDINDELAEVFRRGIQVPGARIHAEATVVGRLANDGCGRVKVRFSTPGTVLPMSDGTSKPLDISMEMNICKDGQPPPTKTD